MDDFIFSNIYNILAFIIFIAFNSGVNYVLLRGKVDEVEFERYKRVFHIDLTSVKEAILDNRKEDMKESKSDVEKAIEGHVRECPLMHTSDTFYTRIEGAMLEKDVKDCISKLQELIEEQKNIVQDQNIEIPQLKNAINELVKQLAKE